MIAILGVLISLSLLACPTGFDLREAVSIPVGAAEDAGISEKDFHRISTEVADLYRPAIEAQGKKLIMSATWESSTVNAYAQREGDEWKIIMLGGLARHKAVTADGFALIVCHEMGHHLGGFPRYDGIDIGWASNEGQSDYFAVMKCLRRLWRNADNDAAIRNLEIPPRLRDECRGDALCLRTGLAGLSAASLFADLAWFTKRPRFETPDEKLVERTYGAHPKAQCRLDTFFQSTLCDVPESEDLRSETEGACHETLGHTQGMRPRCWFKPSL